MTSGCKKGGPTHFDYIVIGKSTCPYTIKAIKILKKNKTSFIYHEKETLSPNNWEKMDCEMLFAIGLMSKGKAQFYNKVPMIFVKKEGEKYDFLENGSVSLEKIFGE